MTYHVHAEVSEHKMPLTELIILGCNEAEVIFLGCLKISWTDFSYLLRAPMGLSTLLMKSGSFFQLWKNFIQQVRDTYRSLLPKKPNG